MPRHSQKSLKFEVREASFHDFRGPGAHPETSGEKAAKKAQTHNFSQALVGDYFRPSLHKKQIVEHLFGSDFYTYFWHRFWEAAGTNMEGFFSNFGIGFEVILQVSLQRPQNCKNATPLKRNARF